MPEHFPNTPMGSLPPKVPGKHRWTAIASYSLSDVEAATAVQGKEPVLLDAAHLFCPVEVGCLDCQERYQDVADKLCPAGDDWSESHPLDVLTPLPDTLDDQALIAGVDLVGRSGATDFEVGYLHDDVPLEKADWYAHAKYRGARITVEHFRGPVQAVEALARKVLHGGQCTHCHRTIRLGGHGNNKVCRWQREGAKWLRGCE